MCIEANRDTVETVPYLTHSDFVKQVHEFTDLCDYLVLSLSADSEMPSGLLQYYTNPMALEKLLSSVTKARSQELGKLAACEYEASIGDDDYLTSVRRNYIRNSLVSSLKPIMLFLKIDPFSAQLKDESQIEASVKIITQLCLEHKIEGLVLENKVSGADSASVSRLIDYVRSVDSERKLVIVSAGCEK